MCAFLGFMSDILLRQVRNVRMEWDEKILLHQVWNAFKCVSCSYSKCIAKSAVRSCVYITVEHVARLLTAADSE